MVRFDINQIETLFRPLKESEREKAAALIPVVLDSLRQEAKKVGKDLDQMVESGDLSINVLLSVVSDVVGRTLMTSTDSEPVSQFSESALGYTVSGTYLVPGGGLFIKKTELSRLGLRRQTYGWLNLYE